MDAEWAMVQVRKMACVACGYPRSNVHHVKTRGAGGGDIGNIVPLCHECHMRLHRVGRSTFEKGNFPGFTMEEAAEAVTDILERRWNEEIQGGEESQFARPGRQS